MYSILDTEKGRLLLKLPACRKTFTVDGKLVKFPKSGMVLFPSDTKISVCKVLPYELHNIRMAKNRQSLHYDAIIEKYGLGQHIGIDEEEILLASLEVLEVL